MYYPKEVDNFKTKLLLWANQSSDLLWLDSNAHTTPYNSYDAILGIDAFTALKISDSHSLTDLDEYIKHTNDWIFGYITYDVKNAIESLSSSNEDKLGFPDIYFFQAQKLFFFKEDKVELKYLNVVSEDIEFDISTIEDIELHNSTPKAPLEISSKITRTQYLEKVNDILFHLKRGDIYEVNFCQEFYVENHQKFDPIQAYLDLNKISKPPFASYFKHNNLYALCSSPERYIKKIDDKIISQPIKGTSKRGNTKTNDENLALALKHNPKEISENVMIVDLVRNDLSKIATQNSVTVEELCKIYTFEQVHQMISTVSADLESDTKFCDILKATFPMGSMTGAPKLSAMHIIEDTESSKRGLYSGCIGYITPDFDFDFNVVIRSILHNSNHHYTSMMVGSAITAKSDPDKEYEECLIKAKALFEVLQD